MRTITVYTFDELKTDEAREKARDWWRALEAQDPAWREEHFESMHAALAQRSEIISGEKTLKQVRDESLDCKFTGYCADCILGHMINEYNRLPSDMEIEDRYEAEWGAEMLERFSNKGLIDDNIVANRYEFLEDGTQVTC